MIKRGNLIATSIALVLPGFTTWLFFYGMPGAATTQWLYSGTKIFMILFPWLFAVRRLPRLRLPTRNSLMLGAGFGLALFVLAVIAYSVLSSYGSFDATKPLLASKLKEFGVTSGLSFLGLAVFITLLNSSLEEYYWRWFLFKRIAELGIPVLAGLLSSVFFMVHHAVILSHYFPAEQAWVTTIPLTAFTGIGGAIWCFVYWRSGSLWAAWISHVFVDAAIMLIGADVLFDVLP